MVTGWTAEIYGNDSIQFIYRRELLKRVLSITEKKNV